MKKYIIPTFIALFLTACAGLAPSIYTPQLTNKISGKVNVANFIIDPSQTLPQTLPVYLSDAIRLEFNNMNALDETSRCTLGGSIKKWDSKSAFSVTIKDDISIAYTLSGSNGKIYYDKTKNAHREYSKYVDVQVMHTYGNRMITDTIRQIVSDEDFKNALERHCR